MSYKIFNKRIVTLTWLLILTILGLYYLSVNSNSTSQISSDNRVITSASPYIYGETQQVLLGEVEETNNAYIYLKLRFRADGTEGNPNVFQTAPVNRGMRLEISGTTASIVLPDIAVAGGLKGLTLITELKKKQWYDLDVEAINGRFVRIKLDGKLVADYASLSINMEMTKILVGGGFDESRAFRGQIDNISITKGNRPLQIYKSKIVEYAFFSFLIFGLLVFLVEFFSVASFYVGLGSVLLAIGSYNSFYFNNYFPVTEGWFSAYAHLINKGLVPYRDFYLFLTPLYPLKLAAFQSLFGESFILLRILGVAVVLSISIFLYLILVRRFSSLVSTISTITAIIYYQSGNAHITYDFIQFFSLYVIAATYLIVCYSDNEAMTRSRKTLNGPIQLFLAGLLVALAFLVKQSNGTLVVMFSVLAVVMVTAGQNFSTRWRNISVYIIGMALPVIALLVWLFFVNALPQFIDQVIFGAINAKGTIGSILFSWIGRHANSDFLSQLKAALLYTSPLLVTSLIATAIHKFRKNYVLHKRQEILLIYLSLFLIIALLCISYYGGELIKPWMVVPGFNLFKNIVAVSVVLPIILILISITSHFTGFSFRRKDLAVGATITIGLIFGNGTSAGISEVSIFLSFAYALAFLMSLPNVYGVAQGVVGVVCLSFILVLTTAKFQQPYAWWYLSEPDVRESTSHLTSPLMKGFRLSQETTKMLEEVTRIIQTYSQPSDDIFTFSNIPIFYVLANRWPHSKVVVSWFDFLPDNLAREEANRLRNFPPAILVNLKLPEATWVAHENLFRGGKPLGQRDIQAAILELIEKRKLYQLDYSHELSPGSVLEIWLKL